MSVTAADSTAFPVLPPELIEEMVSCAAPVRRTFKKGDKLYQAGDRDFGFFVIVAGQVEIRDGGDDSRVITTYGPGQFTGDVALLTGGPSLATGGVARTGREEKIHLVVRGEPHRGVAGHRRGADERREHPDDRHPRQPQER